MRILMFILVTIVAFCSGAGQVRSEPLCAVTSAARLTLRRIAIGHAAPGITLPVECSSPVRSVGWVGSC